MRSGAGRFRRASCRPFLGLGLGTDGTGRAAGCGGLHRTPCVVGANPPALGDAPSLCGLINGSRLSCKAKLLSFPAIREAQLKRRLSRPGGTGAFARAPAGGVPATLRPASAASPFAMTGNPPCRRDSCPKRACPAPFSQGAGLPMFSEEFAAQALVRSCDLVRVGLG